eukprot:CAMPEP_0115851006 /NCGR_PEP_ID=MMETSP0287-20121206/12256_1 /TAXON_ID=412157 /ORGANISM="Chrysochromulina rotalis, Strain UIO044" /LENGTH=82 /DNA_ID=CAMNT_0003305019 /DNA_START=312 /DNA_END=560 /DNA_ORIENTATION=-
MWPSYLVPSRRVPTTAAAAGRSRVCRAQEVADTAAAVALLAACLRAASAAVACRGGSPQAVSAASCQGRGLEEGLGPRVGAE